MTRPSISLQDVVLAQELASQHAFVPPPSQACLLALAAQTNSQPLPEPKPRLGLRIPPEADCILGPNYQLVPRTPPPRPDVAPARAAPPAGPPPAEPAGRQLVDIADVPADWSPPARDADETASGAAAAAAATAVAPVPPPMATYAPPSPAAPVVPLVAPPPPAAQMPDDTDDLLDPFMEEF